MKLILKNTLIIFFLLIVSVSFGQSYTFRVLANKGTNKLKKPSGQVVLLKTGATLNSLDKIITTDDSYIGLMHKSGKTLEINKKGSFLVKDLEGQVVIGATSVTSRYAKFISDRMAESESGDYRSRLNASGSVSRAIHDNLYIAARTNTTLLSNTAIIRWYDSDINDSSQYIVYVRNILDDVVKTYTTNKTSIEIDFDSINLDTSEPLYIISVSNSTSESEVIGINRNVNNNIVEDFTKLKDELSDNGPLNKLIFASFFEEHGLLLDALTQYEKAVLLAPDVIDFQELYEEFLESNNLITN